MTGTDEASQVDHYRVVVSRDGAWWTARTYGPYLPEDGAEARSRTLAGLKDESSGQASNAHQLALMQAGQPYEGQGSVWFYEYDLGGDTAKLDGFRQAAHTYRLAWGEWAGKGHEIASALADDHKATLGEIADIMNVDYPEAALLLTYQARPTRLFSGWWERSLRYRLRHELPERVAFAAKWRARQLAVIAADKLRAAAEGRSVSRT